MVDRDLLAPRRFRGSEMTMATYSIRHRFHKNHEYSQPICAESVEAAYVKYAADPGDFTDSDDAPFDASDLVISEIAQGNQVQIPGTEITVDADDYVVIDDGGFRYPMDRDDL